ncbi:MAG: response regulator [Elusimicrobia bacterium]|nr:response regulator [Elusimicrobiota bacterium]
MNKKILIIEDEKKIIQLLKINFIGEGYEVEEANSGEEGLKKVNIFKPDLIILDVMLPQMSGWEVCKNIKNNPAYKDILVVILTASTQKSDMNKAVSAGADGFFGKPFEIDFITGKIKELFEKRTIR